ncbi:hypothetical protein Pan216_19320 [Planctomycetes bacterium Pan216]|uniref:Uncharacterized protein n=1 Tax=Kolteria novifilia TaxID=2527975 RepID=A0A518B270_9BACT|nr:hypothetical protein Pan216_19320 [Planctomycetes bacterium Pan216]
MVEPGHKFNSWEFESTATRPLVGVSDLATQQSVDSWRSSPQGIGNDSWDVAKPLQPTSVNLVVAIVEDREEIERGGVDRGSQVGDLQRIPTNVKGPGAECCQGTLDSPWGAQRSSPDWDEGASDRPASSRHGRCDCRVGLAGPSPRSSGRGRRQKGESPDRVASAHRRVHGRKRTRHETRPISTKRRK